MKQVVPSEKPSKPVLSHFTELKTKFRGHVKRKYIHTYFLWIHDHTAHISSRELTAHIPLVIFLQLMYR